MGLWLRTIVVLALCRAPVFAQPLANQDYEVPRQTYGYPGSAVMESDRFTLAAVVGEDNGGQGWPRSGGEVRLGFLGGNFGSRPFLEALQNGFPGAVRMEDGVILGISWGTPVVSMFSEQIQPDSLPLCISAKRVEDASRRAFSAPIPWSVRFSTPEIQSEILPRGGQWEPNTLYEVRLSTALRTVDGFPLNGPASVTFLTLMDPARENVVWPARRGSRLTLQPGALKEPAFVVVREDPLSRPDRVSPGAVQEAIEKARRAQGDYRATVAIREINAYGSSGHLLQGNFGAPVTLELDYPDQDRNGIVDGTAPPIRVSTLAVWRLDEEKRLWIKVPSGVINSEARTVTAAIPHLSVYALLGAPDTGVQDVYAFPVPWRPNGSDPRYGTPGGGITFANLPSECVIRIHTLTSELVREIHHTGGAGTEGWDGKTAGGAPAASGVYLYQVESDVNLKFGKLMVIR